MAKRLTKIQIEEIIESFIKGKTIEVLSKEFNCTRLTIKRNLKKNIGESSYEELINNKISKDISQGKINENIDDLKFEFSNKETIDFKTSNEDFNDCDYFQESSFLEISPMDYEIDNSVRKELSSVSLNEIVFPKLVYMIVDKNIELEIKLLKNYPEWDFLPNEDLNRKTIEIYFDLKKAKRSCNKEKKVIKVPNTNVFRIVSPILISRGISRIVSEDKLIAL